MGTGIVIKKELILMLSFIIWLLCFIVKIIKENKKIDFQTVKSALLKLALIEYLTLLIGVTLFPIRISNIPNDITPVINLNIVSIFDYGFNKYAFINIAGNILLLAPLPILLYFNGYNKKVNNLKHVILLCFSVSLCIEILQYFESYFKILSIPRATDILDLICNTLGGVVGYLVLKVYKHVYSK
ncbi:VanZ family protein [Hathewaya massiliensis]|uniref:VanZ family protein n=1 Tax=Hathewaya massiliensis TaxID=1964382 RepID=UPI0011590FA8|nr:VanZ family protein [Hathewaya massiliensis]